MLPGVGGTTTLSSRFWTVPCAPEFGCMLLRENSLGRQCLLMMLANLLVVPRVRMTSDQMQMMS